MKVHTKLVMIIEPHLKISQPEVNCSHIVTFITFLEHLLIDKRSSLFEVQLLRAADCDSRSQWPRPPPPVPKNKVQHRQQEAVKYLGLHLDSRKP
jgi:hypothetical protein